MSATPTDWEAIERAFRAGAVSLREIGRLHSISEGAIRKRAKAEGWQRDLTQKVRQAVRTKLVRIDGTQSSRVRDPRTDAEIVDEASDGVAGAIRLQRKDITSARSLGATLLAELLEGTRDREEIEEAIEVETAGDENGKRRAQMLAAVSLPSRATTLKALADATRILVGLERQALGMDDGPGGDTPATPATRPDMTGLTDEQLRALAAIQTR